MAPNWQLRLRLGGLFAAITIGVIPRFRSPSGFDTEHEANAESPEPVVEPWTSVDRPDGRTPPGALGDRVDALERSLTAANAEVALLRSDVATLVRAVDDIRARSRKPAVAPVQAQPNTSRTASVMAGLVVAMVIGGWLWMSNRASAEHVVPTAPAENSIVPTAPVPTPEPAVTTPAAETPPLTQNELANKPAGAPAAASPVGYVGTLSIDAEPGGEVFIDLRSAGRTPLRVANLRAGSHLIWIERDGYQRFTRIVQVPADRVSRVWADLEPITPR